MQEAARLAEEAERRNKQRIEREREEIEKQQAMERLENMRKTAIGLRTLETLK